MSRHNPNVIRELAETRREHSANKGVIVTSTYLTKGALEKVTQEAFILQKLDRDDVLAWIAKVQQR